MKSERQKKILEIIERESIETQNQLIEALAREGVRSTQATLSRDIRDMHLVKEMSPEGVYHYTSGGRETSYDYDIRLKKIFRESVVEFAVAQNLIVIKTLPGLADAAGSTLDGMDIPGLVGSIAGDDTVFVAMKDNDMAERLCQDLAGMV